MVYDITQNRKNKAAAGRNPSVLMSPAAEISSNSSSWSTLSRDTGTVNESAKNVITAEKPVRPRKPNRQPTIIASTCRIQCTAAKMSVGVSSEPGRRILENRPVCSVAFLSTCDGWISCEDEDNLFVFDKLCFACDFDDFDLDLAGILASVSHHMGKRNASAGDVGLKWASSGNDSRLLLFVESGARRRRAWVAARTRL